MALRELTAFDKAQQLIREELMRCTVYKHHSFLMQLGEMMQELGKMATLAAKLGVDTDVFNDSDDVKKMWRIFDQVNAMEDGHLDHTSNPEFIAVNIKKFMAAVDKHGFGEGFYSKSALHSLMKDSFERRYLGQQVVRNQWCKGSSLRCWIFQRSASLRQGEPAA